MEEKIVKPWKDFLDSLDTAGGIVLILFLLMLALLLMATRAPSDWLLRLLDMTAGAFFGALVGRSRANGTDPHAGG